MCSLKSEWRNLSLTETVRIVCLPKRRWRNGTKDSNEQRRERKSDADGLKFMQR